MSTEYRVRFHASDLHAETVAKCDSADEARAEALDRARTAAYGGVYYTAEEREEGGAWTVLERWTREDADDADDADDGEKEPEPPTDSFAGKRMDDVTIHAVHLHGGKAVVVVESGYAYDDDSALSGPIIDARSYLRECLPAGWDVNEDEEILFGPAIHGVDGVTEQWTFTLKRTGA